VPARTDEIAVHINGATCARWSAAGGVLTLTGVEDKVRVEMVVRSGDRTIVQEVSPGDATLPPPLRTQLDRAMSSRGPPEQVEAVRRAWREIAEPIMREHGVRPPTAEQQRRLREHLRGTTARATPTAEPLRFRYSCRGDSVELELPDTDSPPIRLQRLTGAGER
jgi:hypothetical protein